MNESDNRRAQDAADWVRRNDLRDWLPPHSGGPPILPPRATPMVSPAEMVRLLDFVDMMRTRGVKEFQTADLRVVFREEVAPAPDNQTTNEDSQPEARPRRYPGGRLVSVPTADGK